MAFLNPKMIEWLKLPARYLFVLALLAGILLFAPHSFLIKLGVDAFLEKYRTYIGITFLLFLMLFLVSFIQILYTFFKGKNEERTSRKFQQQRLRELTVQEKKILGYYIINQTRTQLLAMNNGNVNELARLGIIYRSSNMSQGMEYFSYNIQPWAWEFLNKHPHLVERDDVEEETPSLQHPFRGRGF
ncbi:superinfection exclusion B family protein [Priestia megaterium]